MKYLAWMLLATSAFCQTHIKANTLDVTPPGSFVNGVSHYYSNFILNGANPTNIFQNQNGSCPCIVFTTDAMTAAVTAPAGSNVLQVDAVAGYASTLAGGESNVVALYGICNVLSANGLCWGENEVVNCVAGVAGCNLHGIETDVNANNNSDHVIGNNVFGYWTVHPSGGGSQGYLASAPLGPGAGAGWDASFTSATGASNTAFFAQPAATVTSNSQDVAFESIHASVTPIIGKLHTDNTGALLFIPDPLVTDAPFDVDTIKPVGVQPPTCMFTSGGGTLPSCTISTGASNSAGIIIATTGTGSPLGTGTITLTFHGGNSIGPHPPSCIYMASDGGAGAWQAIATMKDKTPSAIGMNDLFTWTNQPAATAANTIGVPVALTASTAYWINYHCWGQ